MIVWRGAVCVVGMALTGVAAAQSCGADLAALPRTIESERYVVAFVLRPEPVTIGKHFVVEFVVCPRGAAIAPASARIDARMPEHRHGMNYRPVVTMAGPGRYRAEGLMFHMGGRWELTFDLATDRGTERVAAMLEVE